MKSMLKLLEFSRQILRGLASRWRNFYYRSLGVKLDGYIWMRKVEIPRNHADIAIAANCALDKGVTLLCTEEALSHPKIDIGANTYINRHTFIDAIQSLKIGKDCGIGPNCYITDHDHGLDSSLPPLQQPMVAQDVSIGDRVWIGANVVILKGVTIGNDAVIGAGSIVTKDVPENAIALGNPARVIKYKTKEVITC